jgi:hypothetical protein
MEADREEQAPGLSEPDKEIAEVGKRVQLLAHELNALASGAMACEATRSERDRLLVGTLFGLLVVTSKTALTLETVGAKDYKPFAPWVLPIGTALILIYIVYCFVRLARNDLSRWESALAPLLSRYAPLQTEVQHALTKLGSDGDTLDRLRPMYLEETQAIAAKIKALDERANIDPVERVAQQIELFDERKTALERERDVGVRSTQVIAQIKFLLRAQAKADGIVDGGLTRGKHQFFAYAAAPVGLAAAVAILMLVVGLRSAFAL